MLYYIPNEIDSNFTRFKIKNMLKKQGYIDYNNKNYLPRLYRHLRSHRLSYVICTNSELEKYYREDLDYDNFNAIELKIERKVSYL